ncbi:hypothetical protein L7F22_061527 [Adiantum nelumboides]|nr:hypothetical protein [Adiantum nelumboides]
MSFPPLRFLFFFFCVGHIHDLLLRHVPDNIVHCIMGGAAAAEIKYPMGSVLELTTGVNYLSISLFHTSNDVLLAAPLVPNLSPMSSSLFFWPMLTSPNFMLPSSSPHPPGFSLGLYFNTGPGADLAGYQIFLSVCAGFMGDTSNTTDGAYIPASQQNETGGYVMFKQTLDGVATNPPAWSANADSPIPNIEVNVSLSLEQQTGGVPELQLKSGEQVLWRVSNARMMEMLDSGILVIYDSPDRSKEVWRSSTNMLVDNQRLHAGSSPAQPQLVTLNSLYTASMEKGGLVLYQNVASDPRKSSSLLPYWFFPLARDDVFRESSLRFTMDLFMYSLPPCSSTGDPAYIINSRLEGQDDPGIFLYPGSCSKLEPRTNASAVDRLNSWLYLQLDDDGKPYTYVLRQNRPVFSTPWALVTISSESSWGGEFAALWKGRKHFFPYPAFIRWRKCDMPRVCGGIGLCSEESDACSCPPTYFRPKVWGDLKKGCVRVAALPPCNSSSAENDKLGFQELANTTVLYVLNGWENSLHWQQDSADTCKQQCLSNCSCTGFFYQVHISRCYFLEVDEVSLVQLETKIPFLSAANYTLDAGASLNPRNDSPINYITFLKVFTNATIIYQAGTGDYQPDSDKSKTSVMPVLLASLSSLVACLVLGAGTFWIIRRRKHLAFVKLRNLEEKELQEVLPLLPRRFSHQELHKATQGFSKLLGAGGCGSVFEGELLTAEGKVHKIAVKSLKTTLQDASQMKQFLAEIAAIGRASQLNVVRLEGFCWEASERLLVYEYVERGSLDAWLFTSSGVQYGSSVDTIATSIDYDKDDSTARGKLSPQPAPANFLGWTTRYSIATGVARGLKYLHEDCEHPILHFDIKPQNILLDSAFVPKLADFGMARPLQRDVSSVITAVRGTIGYIAPDWFFHGSASKKSDIYSLGMVMLEILAGRKVLDFSVLTKSSNSSSSNAAVDQTNRHQGEYYLPSWAAKKCQEGVWMDVVDRRLLLHQATENGGGAGFDIEQAQRLVYIAFWCIQEDPGMRPNASKVVEWLESSSSDAVTRPPFHKSAPFASSAQMLNRHLEISQFYSSSD